jgi:hypothetical protein
MYNRVQIIRDNASNQVAKSVFSEMRGILKEIEPESPIVDNSYTLPLISVEQAMKELLEMENEINQEKS